MTRRSPYVITLSAADRVVLEERARAYTAPFAQVVRAKIVLLAADGEPNMKIAERLDVHVDVVSRWRRRYVESGLAGLADRQRSGRPRSFPPEVLAPTAPARPTNETETETRRETPGAPLLAVPAFGLVDGR